MSAAEKKRKVGITELVSTLGDDRIKLQFIDQCATSLTASKSGVTRITFVTEGQPLTLAGTRDVGIVLWLPRDEVKRIVFGPRPEPTGPHTPGPWRAGKAHGAVVADSPVHGQYDDADTREYYGGNLVAESIAPHNLPLIIAATNLLAALEELVEWTGLRDGSEEDGLRPLEEQYPEVQRAMRAIIEARGGVS